MKYIYPIIILLFLAKCSGTRINPLSRTFEGTVTYTINYNSYNPNVDPEEIKNFVGSKMIMIFKNGCYKKQYFDPEGNLLREQFLELDKNKSYMKIANNDTIYWYDISKKDTQGKINILSDTTINDHPVRGVELELTAPSNENTADSIITRGIYYYSKIHTIDPDIYRNYNETDFNEVIKYGKGILIHEISQGLYWETILSVKSIDKTPVSNESMRAPINEGSIFSKL